MARVLHDTPGDDRSATVHHTSDSVLSLHPTTKLYPTFLSPRKL